MFTLIILLSWLWCHVVARFIIWPSRLEGTKWLPTPNASSWYRITDLPYKLNYKYLPYAFAWTYVFNLGVFISLPYKIDMILLTNLSHICTCIWWPAYMELKMSFLTCGMISILAILTNILNIIISNDISVILLCIVCIFTQMWFSWMSFYMYFFKSTLVTTIEYKRRTTREVLEV